MSVTVGPPRARAPRKGPALPSFSGALTRQPARGPEPPRPDAAWALGATAQVGKNGHRRIPPTYWPATKSLLSGLACFVGIHFSGQYPISRLASSEFLASSTFWERYFYLQIACSLQRFQYYFIWLIAEGACIATGLGYNGRDASGHILWSVEPGRGAGVRPSGRR